MTWRLVLLAPVKGLISYFELKNLCTTYTKSNILWL